MMILGRAIGRQLPAVAVALLAALAATRPASAVTFTNVTASAGINHVQNPGNAPGAALFRTGGAAAADYDNDGWVDLFVTRLNARDLLYRNKGDGTFQDVAVPAGLTINALTNGPAWGDIDNDGDKDLYVTSSGGTRNYLYVNNGNGAFSEQGSARGAALAGGLRFGQSASFGDYDGDGYLDIHTNDWGSETAASTSRLLRNLGAANPGHFEDVTAAAGLNVFRPTHFFDGTTDTSAYRYASTFTDLDRDGHMDLAISSDFLTSQLFWNNGDGTFTDGTIAAGVGTDEDGMGSAIGDYDGDGRLDWFVSALVDVPGGGAPHSGNRLFRNNGDRTFSDQTDAAGVRNSGWSWGSTFLDHDNDRDLDLIVTNGFDPAMPDQSRLFRNDGGVFTDISSAAGVTDTGLGRGLLSFDYDNDGDLDVFIVNHGAQPFLYRNDGGDANAWLKIKLEGTDSNRDGVGAFITLDPDSNVAGDEIVREIHAGSNFLSQNELTAHFGLGADVGAIDSIMIEWPSGMVQKLHNVSANRLVNVVEGGMPGDFNGDRTVDGHDFLVWQRGESPSPLSSSDLAEWKANFGATLLAAVRATPVPEPGALALLLMGLVFFQRQTAAKAW
jgi:hypothetical protein